MEIDFINEDDYDAVHGNVNYIDRNETILCERNVSKKMNRRKIDWANMAKKN